MYYSILRPGAQRQIKKIGQADLVIGLPSYKNPAAASHVARIALAGAHRYYPHLRCVLINADAGYPATTRRAIAEQATTANGYRSTIVTGRYNGPLGQGNAIAALLDAALALDARAILILDSHTHTLTPRWVAGLAHLVLEDRADLVMPRYQWSRAAGALSDLIAYPLFRALWGRSVRHPAAPDFALSPRLAEAVLDEDIWQTEAAAFGLPPWLTTYAVLGSWRVAQAALGQKRTGDHLLKTRPKQAETLFRSQFHNILSVLFRSVYLYQEFWPDASGFYSLSTLTRFGSQVHYTPSPQRDPTPLLDALALGWIEYRALWQRILTPENLARVEGLAALSPTRFYFSSDLWARIIYDFAVVFNQGDCDPYQVVNSLYPLYQGRLAAFGQEVAGLALVGREGTVAAQAVEFEETRPYLKIRWHTARPWLDNDEI